MKSRILYLEGIVGLVPPLIGFVTIRERLPLEGLVFWFFAPFMVNVVVSFWFEERDYLNNVKTALIVVLILFGVLVFRYRIPPGLYELLMALFLWMGSPIVHVLLDILDNLSSPAELIRSE